MSRGASGKAEWRDQPLITTEIPLSLVSIDPHLSSTLLTDCKVSAEVSVPSPPRAVCDLCVCVCMRLHVCLCPRLCMFLFVNPCVFKLVFFRR